MLLLGRTGVVLLQPAGSGVIHNFVLVRNAIRGSRSPLFHDSYTCPLVSGYALMPDRKGTVSGFVVAGFGAGAAVFDAVATAVVNPSNTPPDPVTGYYGEVRDEEMITNKAFGSHLLGCIKEGSQSAHLSFRRCGGRSKHFTLGANLDLVISILAATLKPDLNADATATP